MKSFGVVLITLLTAFAAVAQTSTNMAGREMSLTDCIQQAMTNNFDMQIERYDPQISLYNLRGAYSGYDPTLNISGEHKYSTGETQTNGFTSLSLGSTNFTLFPPENSDQNIFASDVGGLL